MYKFRTILLTTAMMALTACSVFQGGSESASNQVVIPATATAIPSTSAATLSDSPTATNAPVATATLFPTAPAVTQATKPPILQPPGESVMGNEDQVHIQPPVAILDGVVLGHVINVEADDVLNVRAEPNASANIIATLAPDAINVAMVPSQRGENGWLPVIVGTKIGWANGHYLAASAFEGMDTLADGTAVVQAAMEAIRDEDWHAFAQLVHPLKGVRFSPYGFVDVENDRLVSAEKVLPLFTNSQIESWGYDAASGEPIDLTPLDYYKTYLYSHDFLTAEDVGVNRQVSSDSMINNIEVVYENPFVVEYHFPGFDEQFGGLDWRSLKVVLEGFDGNWYVVGVVNAQWTP